VTQKPIIVVGGGPIGLMCALYIKRRKGLPVIIIEHQDKVGGLYASKSTRWGWADQGVHIPQLSGVPELDELFFRSIPFNDWQILSGSRKDIAGNFFRGKLNAGSLYPDLRELPCEQYRACVGELFLNLRVKRSDFKTSLSLQEYLTCRFGSTAAKTVFEPIARKVWRRPLEEMSPWAAKLLHLTRLVTHDSAMSNLLKQSPVLDEIIGFPEQLRVPENTFINSSPALYPKKFGLSHVVEGWVRELIGLGVSILTSTEITSMNDNNNTSLSLQITSGGNAIETRIEPSTVLWTSPISQLERLLGVKNTALPDPSIPHRVVHIFTNKPPSTGPLFWFWSFDNDDCFIRISIPHAYCPAVASSQTFQVCIELHLPSILISDDDVVTMVEHQLRNQGIITKDTQILGHHIQKGNRSYLVPTIKNCNAMRQQRHEITLSLPNNILLANQDIASGVFFMPEILRSIFPLLEQI